MQIVAKLNPKKVVVLSHKTFFSIFVICGSGSLICINNSRSLNKTKCDIAFWLIYDQNFEKYNSTCQILSSWVQKPPKNGGFELSRGESHFCSEKTAVNSLDFTFKAILGLLNSWDKEFQIIGPWEGIEKRLLRVSQYSKNSHL